MHFMQVHASILTHRHRTVQIPWLSVVTLSDFNDKDMWMSIEALSQCTARILQKPPLNNAYSFSPICSHSQIIIPEEISSRRKQSRPVE